jgi:mRNA interferase RelE/StbE
LHSVGFTKGARGDLKGLTEPFRTQIANCIRGLAQNPFPQGVKKLKGGGGYRVRSGDFRVLYTVEQNEVTIYAIGNRKDIYR